jgi:hypothetical protein
MVDSILLLSLSTVAIFFFNATSFFSMLFPIHEKRRQRAPGLDLDSEFATTYLSIMLITVLLTFRPAAFCCVSSSAHCFLI